MQVFRTQASLAHDPSLFFRRGKMIAHPESAERFAVLDAALTAGGFAPAEPPDFGEVILAGVHHPDYVRFLKETWDRRAEVDPGAEELLTTQFSRVQMNRRPGGLAGQIGYYTADTSTPIRAGTWRAAYGTAQAAAAATDAALADGLAYALCRPPGHHAFADCAGGFCYLNNTAVAAQRFLDKGARRVAVLDVDVHHGNGTQGVFYRRADVLTVSLHADTSSYFPYFCGYADEIGEGLGEGFNLNLPIAHGRGDEDFQAAVQVGLARIAAFGADAIVIALGLDAAKDDPLGVLNVTTDGFTRAAEAIAAAGRPTAIVQEGGYLCDALPINLIAFLKAFEARHPGSSHA